MCNISKILLLFLSLTKSLSASPYPLQLPSSFLSDNIRILRIRNTEGAECLWLQISSVANFNGFANQGKGQVSFRALRVSSYSSSSTTSRNLVLYSKPGCCLCDVLKEKIQTAFSLSGPDSLHDVVLQIRDITSNPDWEKAYQYEIPVLAKILPDGTEEVLPRLSPRLGVELVQKKIAAALR